MGVLTKKTKKVKQKCVNLRFFLFLCHTKTINFENYGKRKKRWQKNEQGAAH